jgi:hypothetical protein
VAILIAAPIAIIITAPEALAEIVVVGVLVDIIAGVAIVRVLVGEGVLITGTPPVHPVRLPGLEAFRITIVHGLPEQVCAILIYLIIGARTKVSISRSRIEIWISVIIMVAVIPETYLLLAQAL